MGFGEAIAACFRKYAVFRGRARRSEYWYFYLFSMLLYLPLIVAAVVTSVNKEPNTPNIPGAIAMGALLVFMLAVWLPYLAVSVRRLHDVGYSGWMYLLAFVPFGPIVLLVFACQKGTDGDNQYGPDPLGPSARTFE